MVPYIYILEACGIRGSIEKEIKIHSELIRNGLFGSSLVLDTAVIDMYGKCGALVSWNALINGYAQHGYGQMEFQYYECVKYEGLSPDTMTFACALKACGNLSTVNKGIQIHGELIKEDLLGDDIVLGTPLVDKYARCGSLSKARDTFEKVQVQDVVLWTTLIASYVEHGQYEKALRCYELMQTNDVSPDPAAFVCTLRACQNVGSMYEIYEIHAEIERHGLLKANIILGNALIDAYAKLGILGKAYEVLDELSKRDIITWTAIISGYTESAHSEEAIKCFRRMQLHGVPANVVTYVCILNACSEIGMIESGHEMHMKIECHGFLEREAAVGSALVDMYVKCESLPTTHEVVDKLPVHNAASWTALVGGYVEYGLPEEALSWFHVMQFEGVPSDTVILACVLKACSMTGNIDTGQKNPRGYRTTGIVAQ